MASPSRIGRYRVTGLLGRGAMGIVYRGVDDALDRSVAIKVMSAGAVADADAWARFKREAQAVARLQHPNIVVIYELGEHEGLPFMALELLDGMDLQRAIEGGLRPDPKRTVPIVLQILAGLGHAHDRGIVHRDLKPSNVFLPYGWPAKLMDFGLARLGRGSSTTGVVGTPHYMSPEQARGGHLDARSDLFSAGLILYEVVTGEKAFTGDSLPSVLYKIAHEEPSLGSLPSSGPWRGLRTVLHRALARNPDSRYPDAATMASDLGQTLFAFGGPVNWATASALSRPRRAAADAAPPAGRVDLSEPGGTIEVPSWELAPLPESETDVPALPAREPRRIPISWALAGGGVVTLAAIAAAFFLVGSRQRLPAPVDTQRPTTTTAPAATSPPTRSAAAPETMPSTTPPPTTRPAAAAPATHTPTPRPPPTTLTTEAEVDRANALLEGRHYPRALAAARAVLERDPRNAEAQTIAEEAEAALVIEDCLARAKEALGKGDKAGARDVLRKGLAVNANEARLLALWREATE